jgi:YesN/AraC family two-component response regulator
MINSQFRAQCDLEESKDNYQYNSQVADILEYINKNISNELTIKSLADNFYLSESYICRIFKAETGTTINKYLTARRISIAKSLLDVGLSVTEVCEKSGFHDYSNFLKAFTKAVGISPKKYSQYSSS